jgi:hypothetical protein
VSREVQEWVRQNGMPRQQIYGAAGGAGRMGYAEGMAPTGGLNDPHTQFGYSNIPSGQKKA